MTAPYLARMIPRMTKVIMELIHLWSLSSDRLRSAPTTDRAFSAMDDIRLATIDIIASITFGTSFDSIRAAVDLLESEAQAGASKRPPTADLPSTIDQILKTIGRNAVSPSPFLREFWTKNFDRKWNSARKSFYTFLGAKLDAARAMYDPSQCQRDIPAARRADNVLEMILEKEREGHLKGIEVLTRSEIMDELATYVLGGSESTLHHHFPELGVTDCIFSNGNDNAVVGQILVSSPRRPTKALSRAYG
jgi:cytochrome P450